MHNFIVCGIFKNESHILSEWIQHYLSRGVDHIYLVNDNSTDTFIPIIEKYGDKITLFHNDIVTRAVGRQMHIYDKYFRPILASATWAAILDLDEFMYSPAEKSFTELLTKYEAVSQIKVDWLHFGSNGHIYQPSSVVSGFTKRATFSRDKEFYSYKPIFKTAELRYFGIHEHTVSGVTHHIQYNDAETVDLVINHYNLQSQSFYLNIKCTRGDVNNWFDHVKKTRDIELFRKYDLNDVEDTRLFRQNKDKFDITQVLGVTDDVTLIITSCNRPALLQRTLESFIKQNTYPIAETFLIDDSGIQGCNDSVIEPFKELLNIKNIYNSVNIGQIQSIDKVYSYVRTKWIFHCEEDWCFLQPGFIEKSMKVFSDNPSEKIYTVWLRPHTSTSNHPILYDSLNRGYFEMKRDYTYIDKNIRYIWGGITFNPGLRKTTDCLLIHPYSICCKKEIIKGKEYVGEYVINEAYVQSGYYAMILADPRGHVDHIGWGQHIPRFWD